MKNRGREKREWREKSFKLGFWRGKGKQEERELVRELEIEIEV